MLKRVNNQGEIVASINNPIEKMYERSVLKIKSNLKQYLVDNLAQK